MPRSFAALAGHTLPEPKASASHGLSKSLVSLRALLWRQQQRRQAEEQAEGQQPQPQLRRQQTGDSSTQASGPLR